MNSFLSLFNCFHFNKIFNSLNYRIRLLKPLQCYKVKRRKNYLIYEVPIAPNFWIPAFIL